MACPCAAWPVVTEPPQALPPRDADGLRPAVRQRIWFYGAVICLAYLALLGTGAWLRMAPQEGPSGANDFIAFWAAGDLALAGRAPDAYDAALFREAQFAGYGGPFHGAYFWLNPPSYFLAVTPFALLPFFPAWMLWSLATAAFLAAMLRLVVPGVFVIALLAAPATFWCMLVGQNGLLTAGLMAGCLALLERRPRVAGLLLGLLTVKPQLGLLFPLVLLMGRHWVVFAAATVTTLALALLSVLLFGWESWLAFLNSAGASRDFLAGGAGAWKKLQSPFSVAFQLTGSLGVAMAAQGVVLVAMVALLAWMQRHARPALRAAALVAAAVLVTPYLHIYDAPLLTTAAAFLLRDGLAHGLPRRDLALIVAGCLVPGAFLILGSVAAPLAALLLLAVALRRAYATRFSSPP